MFHVEDVLQLKEGEEVRAIARRHILLLVPPLLGAALLIVVPFFLLFPLFSWGIPGVILFSGSVLCGLVIAVRTLLLWDADVFIVTTLRVVEVDQTGLLTRTVFETALSSIQDANWSQEGVLETVFRMGTITITTTGAANKIIARGIPLPRQTFELISELRHVSSPQAREAAAEASNTGDRTQRLKNISRLLETYSPEELTRIEAILKARERSTVTEAFLKGDEASGM